MYLHIENTCTEAIGIRNRFHSLCVYALRLLEKLDYAVFVCTIFFFCFLRSFIHSFIQPRYQRALPALHTQPNSWEKSVKVNVQEKLFEFLLLLPSGFLLFTCIIYKETYTHLTLLCLRIMWFSSNGAIPWTVNALFCEHMESESLCFFSAPFPSA